MNKFFRTLLIASAVLVLGENGVAQGVELSLQDIIVRAKEQSISSKIASTRKENRYWQYMSFKSDYNPQLTLSGNIPNYDKNFTEVRQPDGSIKFQGVQQANSSLGLGLEQPIPWTAGTISANTRLVNANNYLEETISWNGIPFNVELIQPILAYNPLRWNKLVEPLRYEESRREYVEEMEQISAEAVDRFFALAQAQVSSTIAKFNLANNDTIYKIEEGRYNIGTTSLDKLLQVELQLLRSQQAVAQSNLDQQTALLRLRSYMGITGEDESFILSLPETIPQFEVTVDDALKYAMQNRSDFIGFERRRHEAESQVAEAKWQRYDIRLTASYGLNNSGAYVSDVYNDPIDQQQVNVGFRVPVLDWGASRSRLKTAVANKELTDYIIAQDEVTFEQEIITQVGQFEMLRLQIQITNKADQVAQERYNVAQNRYLIGKIDITNLNIALTEKDNAKRDYLQALRSFWVAYYDLRRLTLYDFSENKLLYNPHLD